MTVRGVRLAGAERRSGMALAGWCGPAGVPDGALGASNAPNYGFRPTASESPTTRIGAGPARRAGGAERPGASGGGRGGAMERAGVGAPAW